MVSQEQQGGATGPIASPLDTPKNIERLSFGDRRSFLQIRTLAHRVGVMAVAAALEQFRTIDA